MKTLKPPQRSRITPYREIGCPLCVATLLVEEGDELKRGRTDPNELYAVCPHCDTWILANPWREPRQTQAPLT